MATTLFWTAVAAFSIGSSYVPAQQALASGRAQAVAGVVQEFQRMPAPAKAFEWFTVQDVRFAYSDHVVRPGFHWTRAQGGPIHNGPPLRIHSIGPKDRTTMLRLEVGH